MRPRGASKARRSCTSASMTSSRAFAPNRASTSRDADRRARAYLAAIRRGGLPSRSAPTIAGTRSCLLAAASSARRARPEIDSIEEVREEDGKPIQTTGLFSVGGLPAPRHGVHDRAHHRSLRRLRHCFFRRSLGAFLFRDRDAKQNPAVSPSGLADGCAERRARRRHAGNNAARKAAPASRAEQDRAACLTFCLMKN